MSTSFRAKATVDHVTKNLWAEVVQLNASHAGETNDEDNSFAKTTPTASFNLTICNKALWGKINPGDIFYVDFTPVPIS